WSVKRHVCDMKRAPESRRSHRGWFKVLSFRGAADESAFDLASCQLQVARCPVTCALPKSLPCLPRLAVGAKPNGSRLSVDNLSSYFLISLILAFTLVTPFLGSGA